MEKKRVNCGTFGFCCERGHLVRVFKDLWARCPRCLPLSNLHGILFVLFAVIVSSTTCLAYKARVWEPGTRENYPAFLISEGVTIAVEPLYTDDLAARVFDKKDMVSRGIMPVAVVIFNDNSFPVEVSGLDIELSHRKRPDTRIRTMSPNEVTWRLLQRSKAWQTQRVPRLSKNELDADMLEDMDKKFLLNKTVEARGNASGFLYLHLPQDESAVAFLSDAMLYIPRIYRMDKGLRMIYFEIDLKSAVTPVSEDVP